jgi:hypothetical protein
MENATRRFRTARIMGFRKAQHNRLTCAACAWFAFFGGAVQGQQAVAWKTGIAFQREMDAQIGISKTDRPLRETLTRLSQTVGVAVFLDRRIDPAQALPAIPTQPLKLVFSQIASNAKGGMTTLGQVVYIGPPETVNGLATLAALRRQDAAKVPNTAKSRLLRIQAWRWDELTTPRELLSDLARQADVTIENLDAVPHDLWPAISLPPLAWVDRMTLLLAGFGMTFEISGEGSSVRLVAAPATVVLEKTYTPRGTAASVAPQLRRIVPDATIRIEQGKLVVAASIEDHDKIEQLLSGQSVRTKKVAKDSGAKTYSLDLRDKPVAAGDVLQTVADNLGKKLKCDPANLPKLREKVQFQVTNVSIDELLTTTLKPLGLTFRITDDAVEVLAAD